MGTRAFAVLWLAAVIPLTAVLYYRKQPFSQYRKVL